MAGAIHRLKKKKITYILQVLSSSSWFSPHVIDYRATSRSLPLSLTSRKVSSQPRELLSSTTANDGARAIARTAVEQHHEVQSTRNGQRDGRQGRQGRASGAVYRFPTTNRSKPPETGVTIWFHFTRFNMWNSRYCTYMYLFRTTPSGCVDLERDLERSDWWTMSSRSLYRSSLCMCTQSFTGQSKQLATLDAECLNLSNEPVTGHVEWTFKTPLMVSICIFLDKYTVQFSAAVLNCSDVLLGWNWFILVLSSACGSAR